LTTNGSEYERKNKKGEVQYTFKRYDIDTKTCENCPLAAKCLSNNESKYRHKRHIDRNEFDPAIERNRRFVEANKPLYRRRQAMVEHPFGTLKRSWGFTYTLLQGLEKVGGEFGIIGSVYNLRRLVCILGVADLKKRFQGAIFPFFVIRRTTDAPVGKNKTLVLTSAVPLDVAA
ncbi:MAG: transposase, partial [Bacteroidia bacterium]